MNPTIFDCVSDWQRQQFGDVDIRGPIGPAKHLAKEVLCEILHLPRGYVEGVLSHASGSVDSIDLFELADVVILTIELIWRSGYSHADICRAVEAKLTENKARAWPPVTTDGVIEHMKTPGVS